MCRRLALLLLSAKDEEISERQKGRNTTADVSERQRLEIHSCLRWCLRARHHRISAGFLLGRRLNRSDVLRLRRSFLHMLQRADGGNGKAGFRNGSWFRFLRNGGNSNGSGL